ncbi:hypothetical protein EON62_05460, partial [archaeon]
MPRRKLCASWRRRRCAWQRDGSRFPTKLSLMKIASRYAWPLLRARSASALRKCAARTDVARLDGHALQVERIIASKEVDVDPETGARLAPPKVMYLVKFRALPYSECTWEWSEDIKDDKKIAQFVRFNTLPHLEEAVPHYDATGTRCLPRAHRTPRALAIPLTAHRTRVATLCAWRAGRDVRPDPHAWKPYKESPAFKGGRT